MHRLLLTTIAAMMLGTGDRSDAEACRFAGTTDPSGKVAITANVTETNGTTQVDVAATFETTTMLWFHIHYLAEEVSIWRSGELETVGVTRAISLATTSSGRPGAYSNATGKACEATGFRRIAGRISSAA
jgi:hypothetical protein